MCVCVCESAFVRACLCVRACFWVRACIRVIYLITYLRLTLFHFYSSNPSSTLFSHRNASYLQCRGYLHRKICTCEQVGAVTLNSLCNVLQSRSKERIASEWKKQNERICKSERSGRKFNPRITKLFERPDTWTESLLYMAISGWLFFFRIFLSFVFVDMFFPFLYN